MVIRMRLRRSIIMMAVMIISFMMMIILILYNRYQSWFHLKTFGTHGSKRN